MAAEKLQKQFQSPALDFVFGGSDIFSKTASPTSEGPSFPLGVSGYDPNHLILTGENTNEGWEGDESSVLTDGGGAARSHRGPAEDFDRWPAVAQDGLLLEGSRADGLLDGLPEEEDCLSGGRVSEEDEDTGRGSPPPLGKNNAAEVPRQVPVEEHDDYDPFSSLGGPPREEQEQHGAWGPRTERTYRSDSEGDEDGRGDGAESARDERPTRRHEEHHRTSYEEEMMEESNDGTEDYSEDPDRSSSSHAMPEEDSSGIAWLEELRSGPHWPQWYRLMRQLDWALTNRWERAPGDPFLRAWRHAFVQGVQSSRYILLYVRGAW